MHLFALRLGLLSPSPHVPAHAAGKERRADRDYSVLETAGIGRALHARMSGQADMAASTQPDQEQVRGMPETTPIPLLDFAAGADVKPDLASMDAYPGQTRRPLKHNTPLTKQATP